MHFEARPPADVDVVALQMLADDRVLKNERTVPKRHVDVVERRGRAGGGGA
jgi:hypothetical protein